MRIVWIAKEDNHFILTDSDGKTVKVTTLESLFDFLLLNDVAMVWNLFELFAIIQQQSPDTAEKINKEDRAWYKDYKIFSSAGKVISIGYQKHLHDNFYASKIETNIYGLRQYFPDDEPISLTDLQVLAHDLMTTLSELGWNSKSYSSPIAIYNEAVLKNEFIPSVYDMEDSPEIDGMLDYCYKMMNREWRAVYQVGHFEAFDYDIRSSYPSVVKDFGNTSECKVKYSKSLQRCDFGVCKGIVHITQDYSPIVNAKGQNVVGSYPDIITTRQWAYLVHYDIGSFEMEDGYFLTFDHPDDKPFYKLMTDLYKMREHGGLCKTLAKAISVGLYGKFGQEYPERYGDYFNPIYSVMATSGCAIEVGKFIMQNNLRSDLISVTVDGCLSTRNVPVSNENVIGSWRKDKVNALILSIGHQYLADKMDSNKNTYSTMIEAIREHPNKSYFNDVLLNKNMMNANRIFKSFPKTGRDLLEKTYRSEPYADRLP